jgi:exopolyphosphatase/guanosine-5'-triphosphate,3'-diphosphate pyrophosphatase
VAASADSIPPRRDLLVSDPVAAVDLGSNSFHLLVAQRVDGELRLVDRLRERVALAAGLDAEKNLSPAAVERALACLGRFGQRLADFPTGNVRAVGTNTLRQARNGRQLLERAEAMLGHPIEIISGKEEARLVYHGVASTHPAAPNPRLVVDVGGGSTECIVGSGDDVMEADSLFMGCLSYSLRYFPGGRITKAGMDEACLAASLEFKTIEKRFRAAGWKTALGSSGTALALAEVGRAFEPDILGLTGKSLRKIRKHLVSVGHVEGIGLPTLQEDRKPVLPGGVAIFSALFDVLGVDRLHPSQGALREGVIHDLLGRIHHEDIRERTIDQFAQRFQVDREQAARVEATALALLEQVAEAWGLDAAPAGDFLRWAARLHEVGMSLSYSGHHRHGAYLLEHADMAGFSQDDQRALATLVGSHRRKLRRGAFEELPGSRTERALRLAMLLRLAARLHRDRTDKELPALRLRPLKKHGLEVAFPRRWLAANPLSRADLSVEAGYLAEAGIKLVVTSY